VTVPEYLRAFMNEPPPRVLDQVRSFLRGELSDADGLDEVRADLTQMAQHNIDTLRGDLRALEALIADPPGEDELMKLVGWDANWVIDEPSGPNALAWLRELARLVRDVLDDVETAR
jgi:hypothetical protein